MKAPNAAARREDRGPMSEDQASTPTQAPPEFAVRLSSDRLRLYVSATDPHAPGMDLAVDVDIEVLIDLLGQACRPGEHLVEYPLLTGEDPEPPRDGAIKAFA